MLLRGEISNMDYVAFQKHVLGRDRTANYWSWVFLLLHFAASTAVCYYLRTPKPIRDALVLCLVSWWTLVLLQRVIAVIGKRRIDRHGFHNVGEVAYELGDESLHFTGTTYSTDIPYNNMTSVIRYSDQAAILFTQLSGFLLPAENTVVEGDLDSFISELEKRLARPSPLADAATE